MKFLKEFVYNYFTECGIIFIDKLTNEVVQFNKVVKLTINCKTILCSEVVLSPTQIRKLIKIEIAHCF